MPTPPYALVRASLNGGANLTGGITSIGGMTVQLSADPAGLAGATRYLWELLDFPPAFTLPAGWALASDGTYYSTTQTPPTFTLLSSANWGKYIIRLTLNGGGPALTGRETAAQREAIAALVDTKTAISVQSVDALVDIGYYETTQFSRKGWVAAFKTNLRLLQTLITGAGGGSGTNNHSALANLSADDHPQYLRTDGTRALTGNMSADGNKIYNLATPTASWDAATKGYVDSTSGFSPAGTPVAGQVVKYDGTRPVWASSTAYAITGFSPAAPTVAVVRVGATVSSPTFSASHSSPPVTLTLTNTDNSESKDVHLTPNSPSSSQSYVKTTNNASVSWTLLGNDGISSANRSTSIFWRPDVYWGTGVAGGNSEAFIEALTGNALQASRAGSFDVNATGSLRVYWAAPASFGTPTFTVGGFSGGFSLVSNTISVTNIESVTQNYQLWVSDTAGLGSIAVTVS
jgi:hypothetical protein